MLVYQMHATQILFLLFSVLTMYTSHGFTPHLPFYSHHSFVSKTILNLNHKSTLQTSPQTQRPQEPKTPQTTFFTLTAPTSHFLKAYLDAKLSTKIILPTTTNAISEEGNNSVQYSSKLDSKGRMLSQVTLILKADNSVQVLQEFNGVETYVEDKDTGGFNLYDYFMKTTFPDDSITITHDNSMKRYELILTHTEHSTLKSKLLVNERLIKTNIKNQYTLLTSSNNSYKSTPYSLVLRNRITQGCAYHETEYPPNNTLKLLPFELNLPVRPVNGGGEGGGCYTGKEGIGFSVGNLIKRFDNSASREGNDSESVLPLRMLHKLVNCTVHLSPPNSDSSEGVKCYNEESIHTYYDGEKSGLLRFTHDRSNAVIGYLTSFAEDIGLVVLRVKQVKSYLSVLLGKGKGKREDLEVDGMSVSVDGGVLKGKLMAVESYYGWDLRRISGDDNSKKKAAPSLPVVNDEEEKAGEEEQKEEARKKDMDERRRKVTEILSKQKKEFGGEGVFD